MPNQGFQLVFQSEKSKSFFTKLSWEREGKGIYTLSYCPAAKEPYSLLITWKDAESGGIDLIYDFIELNEKNSFVWYNKRGLVKPLFLATTSENQVIISEPGDRRLMLTHGLFCYTSVITNNNYPDFHPAGVGVGLNDSCAYVANSAQDCIHRYSKSNFWF